jgi:RNA polymerase-interacting CarD/CdnL/TRCF family regulator
VESTGLTESQTPKWQRLERKELRLRADQLDELARLRRALNRQRRGEGERITENTLIRVAVDLLLKQSGALQGSTEDELRNSVTSEVG